MEDWKYILKVANENLLDGYSIMIVEPDEGFYDCEIRKDGELIEVYASNYYENELVDLIQDAWHYIKTLAR